MLSQGYSNSEVVANLRNDYADPWVKNIPILLLVNKEVVNKEFAHY